MKTSNNHILLIEYHRISLYQEIDNEIKRVKFSNGKDFLSNCVTFSFDKEDLEYLPYGDPFDVNCNSAFSDFLNFAGYTFSPGQAISEMIKSLITSGLIPNLKKDQNIFICLDDSYYEDNESSELNIPKDIDKNIEGHSIFVYDFYGVFSSVHRWIVGAFNRNTIIVNPFFGVAVDDTGEFYRTVYFPTCEYSSIIKANEKYPLPTNIPDKLLRNIRNRIVVSKLFDIPLITKAQYRNQIIDFSQMQLTDRFDEILEESNRLYAQKFKDNNYSKGVLFDFGCHPRIKDAIHQSFADLVVVPDEDKPIVIYFILRVMLIIHKMMNDLKMKLLIAYHLKTCKEGREYEKYNGMNYFDFSLLLSSYQDIYPKVNFVNNCEFKKLYSLKDELLKDKDAV